MTYKTFNNLFDTYLALYPEEGYRLKYNKYTFKHFIDFFEKYHNDIISIQTLRTYIPIFQRCGYAIYPDEDFNVEITKKSLKYLSRYKTPESKLVHDFICNELKIEIGSIYFLYVNGDFNYDSTAKSLKEFFPKCKSDRAIEIAKTFYKKFIKEA